MLQEIYSTESVKPIPRLRIYKPVNKKPITKFDLINLTDFDLQYIRPSDPRYQIAQETLTYIDLSQKHTEQLKEINKNGNRIKRKIALDLLKQRENAFN